MGFFSNKKTVQEDTLKADILDAWEKGDMSKLVLLGLDGFMNLVFSRPISFKRFISYTGSFLDSTILDISKKENLKYAGGKFRLSLQENGIISMTADLYFQNSQQKWILKQRKGSVNKSRFYDWAESPELIELRQSGTLELPITEPVVNE